MMSSAAFAAVAALCAATLAGCSDAAEADALRIGSPLFELWKSPPVQSQLKLYIFNLTNAYDVLSGKKPIVDEVGPYVYDQKLDKEEIVFNENGTVSYRQKTIYSFNRDASLGEEDDVVVIPNFLPLVYSQIASKAKVPDFLLDLLALDLFRDRILPFFEVNVGQFLIGFEDPNFQEFLKRGGESEGDARDVVRLLTNGTSDEVVTVFTGATDIARIGRVDQFDGDSALHFDRNEECNRIDGSDGFIFPPHITKNTTLHYFNKWRRLLPLEFLHEVEGPNGTHLYRFTPPKRTFADAPQKPTADNCFSASGWMQVRYQSQDLGMAVSFPHFLLGDPKLREAVGDEVEPDPDEHMFYVDVDPVTGVTVGARFRLQLNFAVSPQVGKITGAPAVVLPIFWYEESFDGVPVPSQEQLKQASTAT